MIYGESTTEQAKEGAAQNKAEIWYCRRNVSTFWPFGAIVVYEESLLLYRCTTQPTTWANSEEHHMNLSISPPDRSAFRSTALQQY